MSGTLKIPRFLCPALAHGIKTQRRSSPSTKALPLVQNIAKLEAYIKELRKDVRKRVSHAQNSDERDASLDVDVDKLYQSLEAPHQEAIAPPKALLPPALCRKLQLDPASRADAVDWSAVVDQLLQTSNAETVRTEEVDAILSAMPHSSRGRLGRRLLDLVGIKASRLTYDLLMDSHASLGQASAALEMFDTSRQAGLSPSAYSYAHLMKAFAVTKDLKKAMALYRHIQKSHIETNLVIDTSLITTCIRAGKIDFAFAAFDALKYKSVQSAPDAQLYSLMIHACSLDPSLSAERAADLFSEMTEKGLKPTKETFNALIHVYAQRKEYFAEAWRLCETMQQNRVEMDKTTWHSLLTACVTNRDVTRARNLVRDMMSLGQSNAKWQPDGITYQLLFRAYAHARVRRSRASDNLLDFSAQAISVSSSSDLWIDEQPFSSNALLRESSQIMAHIRKHHPQLISTQILDTYMTIAPSFEALDRFKHDWANLYSEHARGRYSYQNALSACYVFKDYALLQQVWTERQAWRAQAKDTLAGSAGPLSSAKDTCGDFEATRLYIECLARLDRIDEATQVLADARHTYVFEKKDLKCFQTKSIQLGNEDAVLLYMDMFPDDRREYTRASRHH